MSAGTANAVKAPVSTPSSSPTAHTLPDVASVAFWLNTVIAGGGSGPNDQVFEYLAPVNRTRLEHRFNRLQKLRRLKFSGAKKGMHSRLVGLAYEHLIRGLLDGSHALRYLKNVRTTTSEIDFLLQVEPFGLCCPILLYARSHILGEAKCHSSATKSEWITELQGLLIAHAAKVAILFVGCRSQRVPASVRHAIALFAVGGYHIVPFGFSQIEEIRKGANFLRVLSDQYARALVHGSSLEV